ncbi:hypothetical protein P154DRAFT_534288 [Amniculicola lignicola CBS 123094]|uniref:Carboxymuconolactone decarboxylase-like domain-containing protein n=1 Tax=Amniculicola lignicola CBS 123094 TaxID=1392246 RepID=A0A6A5WP40_9PLEO|nr:hypothetical protein P154DRAFT_534288 [Amniculicola lignicola CBS 123094]
MSRIPPTPRDELDAEQQKVHDHFAAFTSRAYGANGETFTYQDERGAFIGGFPLYVQHPRIAFAHNQLAVAISRIAIPERVRNIVTLAVAGRFQAASEMSSQGKRYAKKGILTAEEAHTLMTGNKPGSLAGACSVAYDVTAHLLSTPGPLPDDLWDACIQAVGEDAFFGLLHALAFYVWLCVGVNALDVPVPT